MLTKVSMSAFAPNSARSISFPSRSHPTFGALQEKLHKLTSWEAPSTSNAEKICSSLSGLGEVYRCIEGLLKLPLTQQALAQQKEEQLVNRMLEDLIRYLDVCGNTRDAILLMKENVREFQSALRRSKAGGELSIASKISDYISYRKQMKKERAKSLAFLKQMDNKYSDCPQLETDHYLSTLVRILREASLITVSILSSLLVFLSTPILKPRPSSRWSLVSKLVHKGVTGALSPEDSLNEFESVDIAVTNSALHSSKDLEPLEKIQSAQRRLEALDDCIEELEDALEQLFKGLIHTRVALLNILSH